MNNTEMTDANKEYLANLPLRLMVLAATAAEHKEVTVLPKVIQGNPGFEFVFPPDHTDHDSTFHAPHPQHYYLHIRSALIYVIQVEEELATLVDNKNAYAKQLARGTELLQALSPDDLKALMLVLK